MAEPVDLDFQRYVERRKGAKEAAAREGAAYAYSGDLRVLRTLDSISPVKLAVEATVRLWNGWAKGELLGTAIKVSPKQFPKIWALAESCSKTLHIKTPTVYIASEISLNAHTFGTNDDAYIVIHSALVDHLSEPELMSVIGHECGHIQNNHVVFSTALYYLLNAANKFLKWMVTPAVLALQSWSRRAEITCDRAGLICARNLDVSQSALLKVAIGSKQLYADLNLDAFLQQVEESKGGMGRFTELFATHPYLPKRIEALRLFAQSQFYLGLLGQDISAGLTAQAVDARTSELLSQ